MGWFARMVGRSKYSVSVDEARSVFLYRERGRRMEVSGERMADGYAVYASSIVEWETKPGVSPPLPLIDDAERQRIAANIRSYFVDRGKSVYLA